MAFQALDLEKNPLQRLFRGPTGRPLMVQPISGTLDQMSLKLTTNVAYLQLFKSSRILPTKIESINSIMRLVSQLMYMAAFESYTLNQRHYLRLVKDQLLEVQKRLLFNSVLKLSIYRYKQLSTNTCDRKLNR